MGGSHAVSGRCRLARDGGVRGGRAERRRGGGSARGEDQTACWLPISPAGGTRKAGGKPCRHPDPPAGRDKVRAVHVRHLRQAAAAPLRSAVTTAKAGIVA